jgi:hypothetical protein
MAKKKIMLKAETHQGTIELPMTDAQALAFSIKLFKNHNRELAKWRGDRYQRLRWWEKQKFRPPPSSLVEPFCKVEFIPIET